MKTDATQISGLTLIDKALEFECMTPKSEWVLNKQKDNPPRLVRLQQLNVLLNVFTPEIFKINNIAFGLDGLLTGQFIIQRDIESYRNIFKSMDEVITASKYFHRKRDEWALDELQDNFRNVIEFKRTLNNVLNHNSGIMEISYPYFYSVIVTNEISNKIDSKKIDGFLSLVIDPLGRAFTKEKLIQDYNYPKDDVYDIDLDWW